MKRSNPRVRMAKDGRSVLLVIPPSVLRHLLASAFLYAYERKSKRPKNAAYFEAQIRTIEAIDSSLNDLHDSIDGRIAKLKRIGRQLREIGKR